jgi:hypothetical protein
MLTGLEVLPAVLASSLLSGPRTCVIPPHHSNADSMQRVDLKTFDLIAAGFYSGILLLKMAF